MHLKGKRINVIICGRSLGPSMTQFSLNHPFISISINKGIQIVERLCEALRKDAGETADGSAMVFGEGLEFPEGRVEGSTCLQVGLFGIVRIGLQIRDAFAVNHHSTGRVLLEHIVAKGENPEDTRGWGKQGQPRNSLQEGCNDKRGQHGTLHKSIQEAQETTAVADVKDTMIKETVKFFKE